MAFEWGKVPLTSTGSPGAKSTQLDMQTYMTTGATDIASRIGLLFAGCDLHITLAQRKRNIHHQGHTRVRCKSARF
jgi:hypothetical protein